MGPAERLTLGELDSQKKSLKSPFQKPGRRASGLQVPYEPALFLDLARSQTRSQTSPFLPSNLDSVTGTGASVLDQTELFSQSLHCSGEYRHTHIHTHAQIMI